MIFKRPERVAVRAVLVPVAAAVFVSAAPAVPDRGRGPRVDPPLQPAGRRQLLHRRTDPDPRRLLSRRPGVRPGAAGGGAGRGGRGGS